MNNSQFNIESIFNEHHLEIFRYIYSRIKNKEEAEDLTSQVFFKVLGKLDLFDSKKSSIRTWIYNIAKNTLIDFYRKNARSNNIDGITPDIENLSKSSFEEVRTDILYAIDLLPENLAELIRMRYILEYSIQEISDILGCEYGSAKVAIFRAKKQLLTNLRK